MENKKMTAPCVSVGADTEQSSQISNTSIADLNEYYKSFCEDDCDLSSMEGKVFTKLQTYTMTEIMNMRFQSKQPVIDGLLYPGTNIIAGASKIGKSFLMLQIGYYVSTGKDLWGFKTNKSPVLYLALEDTLERLQQRFYRMYNTEEANDFYLTPSAGKFGDGLEEEIKSFLRDHPGTSLVIIDTLQKVREPDDCSYAKDYEIISKAKAISDEYGICIILVHHTRKMKSQDIFEMISGTNGILGAADAGFILAKEDRTSNNAVLDAVGRDQVDQRIYLRKNEDTLEWEFQEAEVDIEQKPKEPLLENLAELVTDENPEWIGTPTELVEALNLDIKANALSVKLNVNCKRLEKDYGILYENNRYHIGRMIKLSKIETTA